jgi:hypothetical protein
LPRRPDGQTLYSLFMEVLAGIRLRDATRQQAGHVQNAHNRLDAHGAQLVGVMRSKDFSPAASIKKRVGRYTRSM